MYLRLRLLILCILLLPLVQLFSWNPDGLIESEEYSYRTDFGETFSLSWSIDGDTAYFAMQAVTEGWLAVGFDPVAIMEDADMVFAWVESTGELRIFDVYSTGMFGPHPPDEELGGSMDILSSGGSEQNGVTTVEFSRKLTTGDNYDKELSPDEALTLIWATGDTDEFSAIHSRAGTATLTLSSGQAESAPVGLLILLHAITLSTGFILMFTGFLIARYGRKKRWWLKIHKPLGVTGAVFSVSGFVIGYIMVEFSTGIHFRVLHSILGILTLAIIVATPMFGQLMLRGKSRKKEFRLIHRWIGRISILLMFIVIILGLIRVF